MSVGGVTARGSGRAGGRAGSVQETADQVSAGGRCGLLRVKRNIKARAKNGFDPGAGQALLFAFCAVAVVPVEGYHDLCTNVRTVKVFATMLTKVGWDHLKEKITQFASTENSGVTRFSHTDAPPQ